MYGKFFEGKSWKKEGEMYLEGEMTAFLNANENGPVKRKSQGCRREKRKMLEGCPGVGETWWVEHRWRWDPR